MDMYTYMYKNLGNAISTSRSRENLWQETSHCTTYIFESVITMFSRSGRLIHLRRLPADTIAVSRGIRAPTLVARRHYAEAHFPDDKVESLQHSQIWKISEAIREDHKQLKDYYQRVTSSKDPDEQERYGNAFIWELARHSIAEEIVVYPAFERDIQDGQSVADKDRAQHQGVSKPQAKRT
jgi:hypothetical protein